MKHIIPGAVTTISTCTKRAYIQIEKKLEKSNAWVKRVYAAKNKLAHQNIINYEQKHTFAKTIFTLVFNILQVL